MPIVRFRWFTMFFPFPKVTTHPGSWFQRYSMGLSARTSASSFGYWKSLSDHNLDDLLAALQNPDSLGWVITELSRQDIKPIVSRLILNQSLHKRKLGLLLFDELELECLSTDSLSHATDDEVRLAFLQTQCSMLDAKGLARLFASLLPRNETLGSNDLITFYTEVELQCRNRGITAVELQNLVGDNPRIRDLLDFLSAESTAMRAARGVQYRQDGHSWVHSCRQKVPTAILQ